VATSGDFDVRTESTPTGGLVCRIAGDLDLATAPRLEEALASRAPGSQVVIDLTGCTFLDSSGVRVLAATARATTEEGGRLDLVVIDPGIARVLEITGIDTLIGVHPTLDAAL
jgi:anti-sigma B factor antagonist